MLSLKRTVFAVICFANLVALTPQVHAAPDAEKAKAFVLDGVLRTLTLFEEGTLTTEKVALRVQHELTENFDVNTIAAYALGPLRTRLTPDQKQRYLAEFNEWVIQLVAGLAMDLRGIKQPISTIPVILTGTTPLTEDQILVSSIINYSETEELKVDWRLRQKGDRFLVLDLIIFGVSQLKVLKSQFSAITRHESRGIEGLIAALQRKNNSTRLARQ